MSGSQTTIRVPENRADNSFVKRCDDCSREPVVHVEGDYVSGTYCSYVTPTSARNCTHYYELP